MQFYYGTYAFQEHAVGFTTDVSAEKSPTGRVMHRAFRFTLNGTLTGSSQADMKVKILALESACWTRYQDLVLFMNDGATSAVILKNQGSMYGVSCVAGPAYPTSYGPENLTKRTFTVAFEATYPAGVKPDGTGVPENLLNYAMTFQEKLSFSGGNPRFAFAEDINGGEPEKYLIVPRTTFKCVQSGTAVGHLGYPDVPDQLFPGDLVGDPVVDFQGSADGVRDWTVTWQYQFESARPLLGLPRFWRNV